MNMEKLIGSTYRIIEKIGHGGGGEVYLAEHLRLKNQVVLKADKRSLSTNPEILRREVDVLKHLNHTYIPQVLDYFLEDGKVWTVMSYVEGESLNKPLRRGERFSQPQVIRWSVQILQALQYLHAPTHGTPPKGFVHSDIKPANIMKRPNGDVCLIDFNIALAIGEKNVVGRSAGYASPEHYGIDFSSISDVEDYSEQISRIYNGAGPANPDWTDEEKRKTEYQADPQSKCNVSADNVATEVQAASSGGDSSAELPTETSLDADTALTSGFSNPPTDEKLPQATAEKPERPQTRISGEKYVIPDARSDIYSLGATMYHLLSGKRPAKNALEVEPLSTEEFSPQIVAIITKAMQPNPDLRYQTAAEMLDALTHLHERDSRPIRLKRRTRCMTAVLTAFLAVGVVLSLAGLKRMQITEQWLKLAEYSEDALQQGDVSAAVDYALQAIPQKQSLFVPACTAQAQKALTDALGIYDLSDGFRAHGVLELESQPLFVELSEDGRIGVCLCGSNLKIFETETLKIIASLPAENSALSEAVFLDHDTLIYAGADGITAYDIASNKILWTGKPATGLALSADRSSIAAVYKAQEYATVYDTESGKELYNVSFNGRKQSVTFNDIYVNPQDNLFALNENGSMLAVSFDDGSLEIFDLENPDNGLILLEPGSGYTHFEGGFYQKYFAFSASGSEKPFFSVMDTAAKKETGGFSTGSVFGVETDESGIYLQTKNLLVKIDPVTGDQIPLITMPDPIFRFDQGGGLTLVATKETKNRVMLFNEDAAMIVQMETDLASDFLRMSGDYILLASVDTPSIRVLKHISNTDAEVLHYDPGFYHDEARISADGNTVMLFSIYGFQILDPSGEVLHEGELPNCEQMFDRLYVREGDASWLEVTYYDGTVDCYDAASGELLRTEQREKPDRSLYTEFITEHFRVTSSLHHTPIVYDLKTGKEIAALDSDANLTYITETRGYLIAQYIAVDGSKYGELLNAKCEKLATLPNLVDVKDGELYFDFASGDLRKTPIYDLQNIIAFSENEMKGVRMK